MDQAPRGMWWVEMTWAVVITEVELAIEEVEVDWDTSLAFSR